MPDDTVSKTYPKGKKKVEAVKAGVFITCEGTYYAKNTGVCVPQQYEIELQLTDDPNYELPSHRRIHHVAFRKLVPHYFQSRPKEYPEYSGLRTCRLVDVQVLGNGKTKPKKPGKIEDMSMNQLVQFAAREDLLVNPKDSSNIADARKAVADEIENRKLAEAELVQQEIDEKAEKAKEFDDVRDILDFNRVQ